MSLGADRFIVKPMEAKELLTIVGDAMANAKPGEKAAPPRPVDEEQVYLKEYNQRLVHKLEKKMLELQELNRALQENEARINKNYVAQRVINALFQLSQEELPLGRFLEKAINLI